jgi:gas vesicle protein
MSANDLTFGIKDVVGIVLAIISILGFLYALKRAAEKAQEANATLRKEFDDYKKTVEEKFLHAKNSKKANIQMIMDTIKANKEEVEKKENQIYNRMNEVREEQKLAHDKLSDKIDSVVTMQQTLNTSLAELTGFLKGKRNDPDA